MRLFYDKPYVSLNTKELYTYAALGWKINVEN